jgi:hypothetical protein
MQRLTLIKQADYHAVIRPWRYKPACHANLSLSSEVIKAVNGMNKETGLMPVSEGYYLIFQRRIFITMLGIERFLLGRMLTE